MPEDILLKPLPTHKDEILRGLEIPERGGLICTDKEMLDRQKGVLVDVLK